MTTHSTVSGNPPPAIRHPQVAVVGAGYWGKNLVRNFAQLRALHTICDASKATLQTQAVLYPGVRTTTRLEEALADPDISGIVLATPAAQHAAHVEQALLAGKHVFVEKPLALEFAQGQALVEAAEARGLALMVGHILEYHPAIRLLHELIQQGELGHLLYLYSNRLNLGKVRSEENILWSFAPHDIAIITRLVGAEPISVTAAGQSYLQSGIADVTLTTLTFASEVRGHIFVSWLHPSKEQKLVIIGDRKMAVFDDTAREGKLKLYDKGIEWRAGLPVPRQSAETTLYFDETEPMRLECEHFLTCIREGAEPLTNGRSGLRVLKVLQASQTSLDRGGAPVLLSEIDAEPPERHPQPATRNSQPATPSYFAHPTAVVDEGARIGEGSKIWHFCHVMPRSIIGRQCSLGQNVFVGDNVVVGDNVKIQNNVSLYTGVLIEEDVFLGPSMVFTNVTNPRSHVIRKHEYKTTLVRRGASIGANAVIVCGVTLGEYCFVGAGAVVTKDVPPYAMVYGNPARVRGWMCQCGEKLAFISDSPAEGNPVEAGPSHPLPAISAQCPACGRRYDKTGEVLRLLAGDAT